jgi:GTP cyclohydrolase II
MFRNKNINVIRAICDLQNGLPVSLTLHQTFKTSSKKFYFIKNYDLENNILDSSIKKITTTERLEISKEDNLQLYETKEEEKLLELIKLLEIEPILFSFEALPEELKNININNLTIEEIDIFTKNYHDDISLISQSPIQLKMAEKCEFYVFQTKYLTKEHYVIKIKNPEKDEVPLIRIHSSCYTGDLLASLRCDCRDQLQESIKSIHSNPNFHGGYILYLMQEGRGIGLANKIKAYKMQQIDNLDTVDSNLALGFKDDERNFKIGVKILEFFNIKEVCLLTNNPKKSQDLEALGIKVKSTISTVFAENKYNKEYLKIKQNRMKHSFKNKKNS